MESSFIQSIVSGKHAFCPKVTGIMGSSSSDGVQASDALYAYQHLYGMPPPPLGEIVNVLEDDDAAAGKDDSKQVADGVENELAGHRDVVVSLTVLKS